MKKIILAILILSSLSVMAQQRKDTAPNSKLEALQNEKNQTVLQKKIKALENGSVEDLDLLIQYYGKDSVKKDAVSKILLKKYPNTENARMIRLKVFLVKPYVDNVEKSEELLLSYMKEYPTANLEIEKTLIACLYAGALNIPKTLHYLNTIEDPAFRIKSFMQAMGEISPIDSKTALTLTAKELENVKKIKGSTPLAGSLVTSPNFIYFDFIDMYGKLLFKAGKNEEAYKYTTEAYNNIKNRDWELTENYAFLSSLHGKYKEALPILSKSVKDGKFDKRYIEQVRKGYANLNPGKDADAYIAQLQKDFIGKIKDQVAKLLINETAPNFVVKDINGKTVSLSDFKGKTIVLDFWATWCGPCVASFPAMQMAVNRYANDPDVKFLFIDTWETVADPLTNAKTFLSKRNYNFDLYIDVVDPVTKRPAAISAFGAKGIPAKFIIDGNGKIRFKMEGFEGKDEVAAEEVSQMIEMARKM